MEEVQREGDDVFAAGRGTSFGFAGHDALRLAVVSMEGDADGLVIIAELGRGLVLHAATEESVCEAVGSGGL